MQNYFDNSRQKVVIKLKSYFTILNDIIDIVLSFLLPIAFVVSLIVTIHNPTLFFQWTIVPLLIIPTCLLVSLASCHVSCEKEETVTIIITIIVITIIYYLICVFFGKEIMQLIKTYNSNL